MRNIIFPAASKNHLENPVIVGNEEAPLSRLIYYAQDTCLNLIVYQAPAYQCHSVQPAHLKSRTKLEYDTEQSPNPDGQYGNQFLAQGLQNSVGSSRCRDSALVPN